MKRRHRRCYDSVPMEAAADGPFLWKDQIDGLLEEGVLSGPSSSTSQLSRRDLGAEMVSV